MCPCTDVPRCEPLWDDEQLLDVRPERFRRDLPNGGLRDLHAGGERGDGLVREEEGPDQASVGVRGAGGCESGYVFSNSELERIFYFF